MKQIASPCAFVILLATALFAKSAPLPMISQPLVPDSVAPGSKPFTLTLNGYGFASNAIVHWDGSPRITKIVSSNQLRAKITAADVAKAHTAWVTVVNPGKRTSNVVYFPIQKRTQKVSFTQQSLPSGGVVAVGDFNNDGILDVALGINNDSQQSGAIEVFLGKGNGSFSTPVVTDLNFDGIFALQAADFNGDGNLDLAVSYSNGFTGVYFFLGDGKGYFTQAPKYGLNTAPLNAIGDFNEDGKIDVISWPNVYLGNGDGTFTPGFFFDDGESVGAVAVGDFNGDGQLDLACIIDSRRQVIILLGNGDGTFEMASSYSIPYASSGVTAVDVNHDGKLDLVTDGISVLLGNGDGTFVVSGGFDVNGQDDVGINVGDFNGDGNVDFAIDLVDYYGDQNLNIFLGKGDGSFEEPLVFNASSDFCCFYDGMGDFNNDGKLDFVLPNRSNDQVFFGQVNP